MFFLLIFEEQDWDGNDDYFGLIGGSMADMLTFGGVNYSCTIWLRLCGGFVGFIHISLFCNFRVSR